MIESKNLERYIGSLYLLKKVSNQIYLVTNNSPFHLIIQVRIQDSKKIWSSVVCRCFFVAAF